MKNWYLEFLIHQAMNKKQNYGSMKFKTSFKNSPQVKHQLDNNEDNFSEFELQQNFLSTISSNSIFLPIPPVTKLHSRPNYFITKLPSPPTFCLSISFWKFVLSFWTKKLFFFFCFSKEFLFFFLSTNDNSKLHVSGLIG